MEQAVHGCLEERLPVSGEVRIWPHREVRAMERAARDVRVGLHHRDGALLCFF